jgi:hypothetical protein
VSMGDGGKRTIFVGEALSALVLLAMSGPSLPGPGEKPRKPGVDTQFPADIARESPEAAAQEEQVAVADQIHGRFSLLPGFGKVRLEDDRTTVSLLWAGAVPAVVESFAKAQTAGATVQLVPAGFSWQDFTTEAAALVETSKANGFVVPRIAPSDDFTEVHITVETQAQRDVLTKVPQALTRVFHYGEPGTLLTLNG